MRFVIALIALTLSAGSAWAVEITSDRQNFMALKGLEKVVQPLSDEELSQIEGQSVSQFSCLSSICLIFVNNTTVFFLTEGTNATFVNTPSNQDRFILRVPGFPSQVFPVPEPQL